MARPRGGRGQRGWSKFYSPPAERRANRHPVRSENGESGWAGGLIMAEYIVSRTEGSDRRPVARLEAGTADEACRVAQRDVTLTAGDSLTAELAEVDDARESERNRTSRDLARDTRGGEGPVA